MIYNPPIRPLESISIVAKDTDDRKSSFSIQSISSSINSNNQLKSPLFPIDSRNPYLLTTGETERNKKQSKTVKLANSINFKEALLNKQKEARNKNSFLNKIDHSHSNNNRQNFHNYKPSNQPFRGSFIDSTSKSTCLNTNPNSNDNAQSEFMKFKSSSKLPRESKLNLNKSNKMKENKSKRVFKSDFKLPLIVSAMMK